MLKAPASVRSLKLETLIRKLGATLISAVMIILGKFKALGSSLKIRANFVAVLVYFQLFLNCLVGICFYKRICFKNE